jgi:hypothetical protein
MQVQNNKLNEQATSCDTFIKHTTLTSSTEKGEESENVLILFAVAVLFMISFSTLAQKTE